jgi:hypothetical protein
MVVENWSISENVADALGKVFNRSQLELMLDGLADTLEKKGAKAVTTRDYIDRQTGADYGLRSRIEYSLGDIIFTDIATSLFSRAQEISINGRFIASREMRYPTPSGYKNTLLPKGGNPPR